MRFIFTLFIFLTSINIYAFKFSPMSLTIEDKGRNKTSLLYVENDSKSPIAIQISMAKRVMDENGDEKHPEVEDDFLIYPPQLILKAKQKRSIKLTWLGKNNLKQEKAYRVIVEQLPIEVDSKKKKSGIKVLLRYIGAVYVNPGKTKSMLKVSKVKLENKKLNVWVKNEGTKHQVLKELKLILSQNKKKVMIDTKSLQNFAGENVLANHTRRFSVLLENHPFQTDKKLKVELDFDK